MDTVITWSANSGDPEAEAKLAAIADWWQGLAGTEVIWQQREIPPEGGQVDWQRQQLDERFVIQFPQLKGITLYWRKPDQPANQEDRNITVNFLELNLENQTLTAKPASGRQYLFRITSTKTVYRQLKLDNPAIAAKKTANGGAVILCRDELQSLEVQITLDSSNVQRLLAGL